MKRWSIRDVARVAGVSPATVSRVLNNNPSVAPDLARRVHEAVRTLEGGPAVPRRILVAMPRRLETYEPDPMGGAFYGQVLTGLHQVFQEAGHDLALLPYNPADGAEAVIRVQQDRADALVLIGADASEELAREAQRQSLPVIVIDRHVRGVDSVISDNLGGSEEVTAHVLRQGYRRLAFVSESFADPSFAARKLGFERAVAESGVAGVDVRQYELGFAWSDAPAVVEELCRAFRPPFAIVAANDMTALHLLGILKAKGLSIPDDVGLAGFDDIAQAGRVDPPLTTVRVDKLEMGRLAARRVLERLEVADLLPVTITMHVAVMERASTALQTVLQGTRQEG